MRLLILGDSHFRVRTPRRRVEDNFLAVSIKKLLHVLGTADKHTCDAIIQVGDWFDSPSPSGELVAQMIQALRRFDHPPVFAIHGQHDLAYHSEASRRRSALRIMEAAGVVTLLDAEPRTVPVDWMSKDELAPHFLLYGADFGQPIPQLRRAAEGEFRILVAHVMVGNRPLFPGHDLTAPRAFAKKHPGFDLYCLGDYHYPFTAKIGRRGETARWVINPGTLIRKTTDVRELAHVPKVVVFDTQTNEPEDIPLGFPPAEEVFDLSGKTEAKTKPNFDFDGLAELLRQRGKAGVDFTQNLELFFEQENTPREVRTCIRTAMEEVSA